MIELLLIVVLLLVVFGAGKVRNAGSDLGEAVKGFRKSLRAPAAEKPPTDTLPDAEFPEQRTARKRGSNQPRA